MNKLTYKITNLTYNMDLSYYLGRLYGALTLNGKVLHVGSYADRDEAEVVFDSLVLMHLEVAA